MSDADAADTRQVMAIAVVDPNANERMEEIGDGGSKISNVQFKKALHYSTETRLSLPDHNKRFARKARGKSLFHKINNSTRMNNGLFLINTPRLAHEVEDKDQYISVEATQESLTESDKALLHHPAIAEWIHIFWRTFPSSFSPEEMEGKLSPLKTHDAALLSEVAQSLEKQSLHIDRSLKKSSWVDPMFALGRHFDKLSTYKQRAWIAKDACLKFLVSTSKAIESGGDDIDSGVQRANERIASLVSGTEISIVTLDTFSRLLLGLCATYCPGQPNVKTYTYLLATLFHRLTKLELIEGSDGASVEKYVYRPRDDIAPSKNYRGVEWEKQMNVKRGEFAALQTSLLYAGGIVEEEEDSEEREESDAQSDADSGNDEAKEPDRTAPLQASLEAIPTSLGQQQKPLKARRSNPRKPPTQRKTRRAKATAAQNIKVEQVIIPVPRHFLRGSVESEGTLPLVGSIVGRAVGGGQSPRKTGFVVKRVATFDPSATSTAAHQNSAQNIVFEGPSFQQGHGGQGAKSSFVKTNAKRRAGEGALAGETQEPLFASDMLAMFSRKLVEAGHLADAALLQVPRPPLTAALKQQLASRLMDAMALGNNKAAAPQSTFASVGGLTTTNQSKSEEIWAGLVRVLPPRRGGGAGRGHSQQERRLIEGLRLALLGKLDEALRLAEGDHAAANDGDDAGSGGGPGQEVSGEEGRGAESAFGLTMERIDVPVEAIKQFKSAALPRRTSVAEGETRGLSPRTRALAKKAQRRAAREAKGGLGVRWSILDGGQRGQRARLHARAARGGGGRPKGVRKRLQRQLVGESRNRLKRMVRTVEQEILWGSGGVARAQRLSRDLARFLGRFRKSLHSYSKAQRSSGGREGGGQGLEEGEWLEGEVGDSGSESDWQAGEVAALQGVTSRPDALDMLAQGGGAVELEAVLGARKAARLLFETAAGSAQAQELFSRVVFELRKRDARPPADNALSLYEMVRQMLAEEPLAAPAAAVAVAAAGGEAPEKKKRKKKNVVARPEPLQVESARAVEERRAAAAAEQEAAEAEAKRRAAEAERKAAEAAAREEERRAGEAMGKRLALMEEPDSEEDGEVTERPAAAAGGAASSRPGSKEATAGGAGEELEGVAEGEKGATSKALLVAAAAAATAAAGGASGPLVEGHVTISEASRLFAEAVNSTAAGWAMDPPTPLAAAGGGARRQGGAASRR